MRYLAWLALPLLAGCDPLPVVVPNDTSEAVRIDIHGRNFPTPIQLEIVEPGSYFGNRYCWEKNDAIFLATKRHPDPIVFDPKDFCDPDECDCEIPVSKLVKQITPAFALERQQDVCAGRGPYMEPDVRAQLCADYARRATGR
jgi:hypothetical protein